jgi:dGTPase
VVIEISREAPDSLEDALATERQARWASTMSGYGAAVKHAHADSHASFGLFDPRDRTRREDNEQEHLAPGATRANGAGNRAREEEPDAYRTCFERDRDRILHSSAFRRLAGKTQVFVFPEDHQRTRLTHALEVAQIARAIAEALRLNVALTEAIALGHDCGHGPGGHASEDAFSPYLAGGYDHAPFGADVILEPLNLTLEVLDGIRNHSWSRPAPATPEGEVVSWADRIAYVCHDFEDASVAQIVTSEALPDPVLELCGTRRGAQLDAFISSVITTSTETGTICMASELAHALGEFRRFNYEHVYLREESLAQARSVIEVLRALVEHFIAHPDELPAADAQARDTDPAFAAVRYVAGMTDRYAFELAIDRLAWPVERLPRGIDMPLGARRLTR